MYKIYDLIESLRKWKGYSLREVAQKAAITYTTLASIMSRRSPTISKRTLTQIATVFEVEWYVLLNCKNESEPVLIKTGRFSDEPRIETYLSEMDAKQILHRIIGDEYMQYLTVLDELKKSTFQSKATGYEVQCDQTLRLQFKQSIDFVLNKLNDEGLMEAMRRVLDIAQDPKFCISTATGNKKEDDECQEEGR